MTTSDSFARDRAIEDIAARVFRESHVSSWPGQCESLEEIARDLRALIRDDVDGAGTATPADPREERFRHLASLTQNWDSYGGRPPTEEAIGAARDTLTLLDGNPTISATANGGVLLGWSDDEIEVSCDPSGAVGSVTIADFEFIRSDVAAAERKVECPICDQWSVHGPAAEEALFEHWAVTHAAAARTPGEPRERQDAVCEEVTEGLFGATLGPCVRRGSHRVHEDARRQTWWRGAAGAGPDAHDQFCDGTCKNAGTGGYMCPKQPPAVSGTMGP